ncbi:dihydropteroate synthase [Chloroflexota bacterium]
MLRSTELKVGSFSFNWGSRTYLMGILNLTPDSFSGDGLVGDSDGVDIKIDQEKIIQAALEQARSFVEAGADILDIGGESTRPGASAVDVDEEILRILLVIQSLAQEFEVLISVDTYKHQVAQAALQAGAHIVNDVWGLHADPEMAATIASNNAVVILMHNRSSWAHTEIIERLGGRYVGIPYDDLLEDIKRELMDSVDLARRAGIPDDKIIIDPGIGFGKSVEQNLELIDLLPEIKSLGYPLLYGPSRKSFIGYTLDQPTDQRIAGTAAAVAVGIVRGADIVRVHDVEFMKQVAVMTDAIMRRQR